jgi:hypothetical protein
MKIFDIILEAKQEIYAIGDRHAFAIGKAGGFKNYASSNRSAFSEENISAIEQVPKGSLVVLSAGTEDLAQQNRGSVIQRVEKLIFSLLKKDCQIYYIPPAATDSPSFIGEKNLLRNQLIKQISADMPNIQILDPGALSIKDSDGLTAPPSWYQSVAAKIKGAAKEIKPQSGQAMAPPGKSDAGGGQSSSEFAKDDPRILDKSADPLGDFITDLEKKKSGEAGQKDQPFMGGQPGYDEAGNKINKDGTPGTTTAPNKNDTPNSAEKLPPTLVVPEKLTGTEIQRLQLALMALGYKVGNTNDDGKYGPKTKAGIEKFQKDNNLTITGKFDKETVDAINKEIAILHKKRSEKPPATREPGPGSTRPQTPGQGGMVEPKDRVGKERVDPVEVSNYLKNKSIGNQHRAGILANIEAESGFIYSDTTGDKGTSWGLFQWNATRRIDMVKAIPDWKTNWKAQIDYALTEDVAPTYLKTDFKSAGEAAMWWCIKWERPFTTQPERQKEEAIKRFKLAKKYL